MFGLSEKQKRGKQAIRGWCALLCAGGLLFLLAYMDDRCVDRAPPRRLLPPEATWRTYCATYRAFGARCNTPPQEKSPRTVSPRRLHEAALAIRLQTGIRPTPSRMRIWLGRQCLIGGQGPHWGGCTYPGLLLRTFSKAHAFLAGPVIASESIYRFRHCYYAWREGYLLFSPASILYTTGPCRPSPLQRGGRKTRNDFYMDRARCRNAASQPRHITSLRRNTVQRPPSYANPYPSRKDGQKTPCVSWG